VGVRRPGSFYERVEHFPPYSRHFLHDVGAFQLGLGTALTLGLAGWDGRRVALWTVATASVVHAASHILDRDLGGRGTDPLALSLLAAAFLAAPLLAAQSHYEAKSHAMRLTPRREVTPMRLLRRLSAHARTCLTGAAAALARCATSSAAPRY
jgi:hypothetical protein